MFRIKICGITSVDDALMAIDQGADALGLNFYSRSSRYLTLQAAAEISQAVRGVRSSQPVRLVGVFVNEAEQKLHEIAAAVGLDAWQLHGDEPPELVARLSSTPAGRPAVVRAFRCREADLGGVEQQLRNCQTAGALPHSVLLDAYSPDAFGGTGQVVDWHVVRQQREQLIGLPVILAGGLTPENVAAAIRTAQPHGVDVASGVEASPGKKDLAKVRDFIAAAKVALAELTG